MGEEHDVDDANPTVRRVEGRERHHGYIARVGEGFVLDEAEGCVEGYGVWEGGDGEVNEYHW